MSTRLNVRERYSSIAKDIQSGNKQSCCSKDSNCCNESDISSIDKNYQGVDLTELPNESVIASLGCANPLVFAELKEGETVLDLGSGGGLDVLLASRFVGETGQVFGLDMTDEMLALANENKAKMGATNVEFIRGYIENVPLDANTVDVVLSNCVINLSDDKHKTISEAYRVLKPGGRLRIADVVATQEFDPMLKTDDDLWCACISGAILIDEYLEILRNNGFENADIEIVHRYDVSVSNTCCSDDDDCCNTESILEGVFAGALIRADKPTT
ncbi:MAG: arsenite methyltransferase [Coriobacteriia bacterium]|nr:arsenite methyltransferase [Coriobacteriia bacterium]